MEVPLSWRTVVEAVAVRTLPGVLLLGVAVTLAALGAPCVVSAATAALAQFAS